MLKIVATISDYGAAMHIGGDVERVSHIIDIPTSIIPEAIKEFLKENGRPSHATLSFSLLKECGGA